MILNAQLGTGAIATNWKVDLFDHPNLAWVNVGNLSTGEMCNQSAR